MPQMRKIARAMKIDQWTPGIKVSWTPAAVQAALVEHQMGHFGQSSKLVEAMWQDDELPTALETSTNFILGADFRLEPQTDARGEPESASEKLAEQLGPYWDKCFPTSEMGKLLTWFRMLGVAVGTLDYYRKNGEWLPKLRVLNPQFLYWDESEIDPQTGLYGVFRYESRSGTVTVTPGDGKWVLLSDGRESWMRCGVRALAQTWLVKQYTVRDWARYNERHGLPIVKAVVPAFAAADDKQNFLEDIKAIGSDTTALLPGFMNEQGAGFDLELLEAMDGSWESFRETIERCDRKFQIYFLGTNTNELIGTAGSRNTSESGRSISMQKAQELLQRVVGDLREQLIIPALRANSTSLDPDMAPWPRWLVEGDEDLEKRAATAKAFGDALISLKTSGYKLSNIEEEGRQYGLELEEREEEPLQMVPGQPPQPGAESPVADTAEKPPNGADDDEELDIHVDTSDFAALAQDGKPVFEQAQDYLDGLADNLASHAETFEALESARLADIINNAKDPEALLAELRDYATVPDPVLGRIYEHAIALGHLSGMVSAETEE